MERARPPRPEGKPSNWWAVEKEPWKRVSAEVRTDQERPQAKEKTKASALSVPAFAEAARRWGRRADNAERLYWNGSFWATYWMERKV